MVRLKADGALARAVALQLFRVSPHGGRAEEVQCTVLRGRPVAHQYSSVETERRELVADGLFRSRRSFPRRVPKVLKCGSLVSRQGCQIRFMGLREFQSSSDPENVV